MTATQQALKLAKSGAAEASEPAGVPHEGRDDLLDPDAWGEILGQFGRTMKLAVAMTDAHGKLIGQCHNAQPVWSLARKAAAKKSLAETSEGCSFCLASNPPCMALADALATGEIVCVADPSGMAHATIPLLLGSERVGALIAGQTFARYPDPLALRRTAKYFGASQGGLWDAAVHQVPVSQATLRLYADLLGSLGQAFLRQRYAAMLLRRLAKTDQRYRMMIEGSRDRALFTVDGKGSVTSWNPGAERLLGYEEGEILGKDYSRFFIPDDVRSGLPGGDIMRVERDGWVEEEGWRVRKDGTRFLSESATARLGEPEAREYGELLHDVTKERKAAEANLQAQKLESIGVLAGGIAHDFNNLLTGISGNVDLAMAGLPANHPMRPFLDIARRAGRKAAALIAQLLAYAEKGDFIVTQFDLSGLVAEILPLIGTSIPKAVQMDVTLPSNLPWISADASEIQQIVMNLVINGAESFGRAGGSLRVSTGVAKLDATDADAANRDGVFLEVRDAGCGMDEATQRKIFDPFFTTKFTGRGLGLAAVSGIVRRLKGRLDVESAPGKGSTFRVIFPAVPAQLPEPPAVAQGHGPGAGLILVVDDDPMIRDFACTVLERCGYTVLTAENGQAAVEMFRNDARIGAVLMDLTMPRMGGGEALELMNRIRPGVPIVISSGFRDREGCENLTGASGGVIHKPYSVSALTEKMASVFAAS